MSDHFDPNIITEKEFIALQQFKQRISDIMLELPEYRRNDVRLVQWLRARELDTKKAELMLRKYQDFRKEYNMDSIMEWKIPEIIDQQLTLKVCGFDKDGALVIVIPLGRWDFRKMVSLGLKSELLLFIAQFFEQAYFFLQQHSTKDNIRTQLVFVMDYDGFPFSQLASREIIELFVNYIRLFEDNHPESLKAAFIVNAPKIFEILFAVVKPLLTMRTLSKVRIFGSNTKHWREALLENIEPDLLPSQYGGSHTSARDYKVLYGLNWHPVLEKIAENEMIPVTVGACTKYPVKFSLSRGSKLCWQFRTLDYDIGFSLLCPQGGVFGATGTLTDKGEEELFTCSRVDSHLHLQRGGLIAEKSGSYTLLFDNSFSRFREKELLYATRVESASIHK